jgi:hypothetical protein
MTLAITGRARLPFGDLVVGIRLSRQASQAMPDYLEVEQGRHLTYVLRATHVYHRSCNAAGL